MSAMPVRAGGVSVTGLLEAAFCGGWAVETVVLFCMAVAGGRLSTGMVFRMFPAASPRRGSVAGIVIGAAATLSVFYMAQHVLC